MMIWSNVLYIQIILAAVNFLNLLNQLHWRKTALCFQWLRTQASCHHLYSLNLSPYPINLASCKPTGLQTFFGKIKTCPSFNVLSLENIVLDGNLMSFSPLIGSRPY